MFLSHFRQWHKFMAAQLTFIFALLIMLPGCWVTSIHSLYEEGKDTDVISDQNFVGMWTATDQDKCTTTLTVTAEGVGYSLHSVESGEACSNRGEVSNFQARLVKLDAYRFLDIAPLDKDVCDWCIAQHQIFLVKIDSDALAFTPIDSDWLKAAVAAKTVTLSTLPDDTDKLISPSKDLKEFCRRFAADKTVFKPESAEVLKRAQVGAS
jgi:hypothetical protein